MPNNLDWQHLPYFLAVARQGSFRAAAIALNTSHVKVARHLDALEASYGVKLFRRTHRGLSLSPAGEELVPLAENAELSIDQAKRTLHGLDKQMQGRIRFSTSDPLSNFILAPLLAEFAQLHPLIELQLEVASEFDDPRLLQTDVSLRMVYKVGLDAVVKKLFPVSIGTYAHRDYISQHEAKFSSRGEGLVWLGASIENMETSWIHHSPFPAAEAKHQFSNPMLHLELAAQGLGMVRLGAFMAKTKPQLQRVPMTEIEAGPPLCLIIHPEMKRVVRVRRFVDFLEAKLRALKPKISFS